MYSAAVKFLDDLTTEAGGEPSAPSHPWMTFPFSVLSDHGSSCCEIAREWLRAMDFAQLNGGSLSSGPRWIRQKYDWGPSKWPIHWCEVIERKVIDCGVHAALAHEAFTGRGLVAFRAQFLQRYSKDAHEQWRTRWADEDASDHWLGEDMIYHEGNALLIDGGEEVRLWDGSAGCWLDAPTSIGYGSMVAVRIFADGQWGGGDGLRWGEYRFQPNRWHPVGSGSAAEPLL
jgi:hypothetical protein